MSLSTLKGINPETQLPSIDLPALLAHLSEIVEWYTFGTLLGVPSHELRKLDEDHPRNKERKLTEVFEYWLKNGKDISWVAIFEALKAIPSERHILNKIVHDLSQTPKIPVPFLLKELTIKEKDALALSLDKIQEDFASLVTDIQEALERKIKFANLKRFVRNYFQDTLKLQRDPKTIDELFYALEEHYCFMNYKPLTKVVDKFVKVTMKGRMEEYSKKLENWLKSTTVQEFQAAVDKAVNPEPSSNQCRIVLKLEGEWMKITVKNLWKLLKYLFGEMSSTFTRIIIREGSVLVMLLAPQSEMLFLLTQASRKYRDMLYLGIQCIQVGNLCFYSKRFCYFSFELCLLATLELEETPTDLLQCLLEVGLDPNAIYKGQTPLMYAAQLDKTEAISLLAEYKADPYIVTEYYDGSAIHFAAKAGKKNAVQILINKFGISPDYTSPRQGFTPLMEAVAHNKPEVVDVLLQNKATVDYQNAADGYNALILACRLGKTQIVHLLLQKGASLDMQTNQGSTALAIACIDGRDEIVDWLLMFNADPNIPDIDGATPLTIACIFKYYKIVDKLLLHRPQINVNIQENKITNELTALHIVSIDNNTQIVINLIDAKADVNIQAVHGITALFIACHNNNEKMVHHLIAAGANPNLEMDDGISPLHAAIQNDNANIVGMLLNARGGRANPNAVFVGHINLTPLHWACCNGNEAIVQLLLDANANFDIFDSKGYTPLTVASGFGHSKVVQQLLTAGANTNLAKNDCSWTPIFFAAAGGHLDVLTLLIAKDKGAAFKKDKFGKTPQMVAAEMGHTEAQCLLSQAATTYSTSSPKEIKGLPDPTDVRERKIIHSRSEQPSSKSDKRIISKRDKSLLDDLSNVSSFYEGFLFFFSTSMKALTQQHHSLVQSIATAIQIFNVSRIELR